MRIPPDALIASTKLTHYLLTPRVKDDKSKYLAQSGFDLASADRLETEIRRVAAERDGIIDRVREHGTYYTVEGEIVGPLSVPLPVKLIWLHRTDGVFSFVTLVPQRK